MKPCTSKGQKFRLLACCYALRRPDDRSLYASPAVAKLGRHRTIVLAHMASILPPYLLHLLVQLSSFSLELGTRFCQRD